MLVLTEQWKRALRDSSSSVNRALDYRAGGRWFDPFGPTHTQIYWDMKVLPLPNCPVNGWTLRMTTWNASALFSRGRQKSVPSWYFRTKYIDFQIKCLYYIFLRQGRKENCKVRVNRILLSVYHFSALSFSSRLINRSYVWLLYHSRQSIWMLWRNEGFYVLPVLSLAVASVLSFVVYVEDA